MTLETLAMGPLGLRLNRIERLFQFRCLASMNATDRVLQAPEINPLLSNLKPQIYAGAR